MPYLLPQTRSTFLVNPQAQDTRPATRQSPGASQSHFFSQQRTEGRSGSGRNSVRRQQGVTPASTMGSATSSYSAAMHHKSRPTCTVSLAHVSAVPSPSFSASSTPRSLQGIDADAVHIDTIAPQVQVQAEPANTIPAPPARRPSKKHLKKSVMSEINVIPFPTSAQTPSPIHTSPSPGTRRAFGARPLPTPPTPHALLRTTASRRTNTQGASATSGVLEHIELTPEHKPPSSSMSAPPRRRARKASASRPIVFARSVSGSSSSSSGCSQGSKSFTSSVSSSASSSGSGSEPSSPTSSVSSATSIEQEQSEEDKLMEVDFPPRPASPTPQAHLQDQHLQDRLHILDHQQPGRKRESSDPPAYSTLPPPYSDFPTEKKIEQEVVAPQQNVEIVAPKPSRPASSFIAPSSAPSASSSANTTRRIQRIPPSELRVLVQLYRTLVHGLEVRYRADSASSATIAASSYGAPSSVYDNGRGSSCTAKEKERERPARKVLGPRRTLVVPPTPSTSPIKPSSVRASISIPSSTASRFPLVEDDDDSPVLASPIPVMGSSTRNLHADRSPRRSPYVSPSSSPPPRSRPCTPTPPPKKEKRKSKEALAAALDVQDALLAIRLRGFLKAQGVQEGDLEVYVEETGVTVGGEGKTREERERDELGALIDEYAMDTEDEEDGKDKTKEVKHRREGPLVEDEDDVPVSSPPPPPLRRRPAPLLHPLSASTAPSQRLSSPPPQPPTSPTLPPGEHKPVVATPRMIALLTMRHRYTVAARRASEVRAKEREKEREAGLEREFGGKDKAVEGGAGKKGRKSGLRVVWVEEQEEEILVEDW
ncbi:unnamed protein product [Cyclocybe aegerita]|uniref:Uncharacterized protein n=1 Tax=Cyclocybe aegerita TaxID=1973307 RepID=A0A8S0W3K7_CYCAE|nr:unnamed protein product [Cyclocybe aegerita]